MNRPAIHDLRIAGLRPETSDSWVLTLAVPEELVGEFAWQAGQHLAIVGDDDVRRSFSIVNAPGPGLLSLGIKQIPGGAFSEGVLPGLRVGDSVGVMEPQGRFLAAAAPVGDDGQPQSVAGRRHVAIAAGSGITPVLAIVRELLETELNARVVLLYGNRTSSSTMFIDDIADLKDRYPQRFSVCHVFSAEQREPELLCGRLDPPRVLALLQSLGVDDVDEFYLCGPQPMVEALQEPLSQSGAGVHFELFHAQPSGSSAAPTPAVAQAAGARLEFRLAGRTSVATVEAGQSVLEAGLLVRPELPFACKGGVCGTCRAKVTAGEVVMRANYALESDEVERGYVLTCQSQPTTREVGIDYDV